jgi:hypothetical protein
MTLPAPGAPTAVAAPAPSPSESAVAIVARDVGGALLPVVAIAVAVVAAYLAAAALAVLVRRLAPRAPVAADLSRRSRRPLRATLLVVAVWVALRVSTDAAQAWRPPWSTRSSSP